MSTLVDWDLAARTGRRLAPPGPSVPPAEARAAMAELRGLVPQALELVSAHTGLEPLVDAPVRIVDRGGWVDANVEGFRHLLEPLVVRLLARRDERRAGRLDSVVGGAFTKAGSALTGAQTGALLAYVSSKVLGQYDVFHPEGRGPGQLLLVAPNIVEAEQRLGVTPADFRAWVVLHEATHQVQFTGVPWLREHFLGLVATLLDEVDVDPAQLLGRLREAAGAVRAATAGGSPDNQDEGAGATPRLTFVEALQSPAQRVCLDRVQALMSLLEGHADVVMDRAGPELVPSVEHIRAAFERRRKGTGSIDRLVRSLLGLDLKLRQYREGAAFVRAVTDEAGESGLRALWSAPEALPSLAEVRAPALWLARVSPGASTVDEHSA